MSLVSIVQTELVDKRKSIAQDDMLNGISLASILPGPLAVNVVAYAGFIMRGFPGALICMTAVIMPSFFLMVGVALAYQRWGDLPITAALLTTIIPAVIAVILHAGVSMGRKVVVEAWTLIPLVLAFAAVVFLKGFYVTLIVIALGGVLGLLMTPSQGEERDFDKGRGYSAAGQILIAAFLVVVLLIFTGKPDIFQAYPLAHLFSTFSGMSLTLFGGGYVFVPMIQKIVVEAYQWISIAEFDLAIAAGQVTPGPILVSATYIGYSLAGMPGAVVATLSMFLPPVLLITVASGWLNSIKDMGMVKKVLQGIRVVVVGMILAAAAIIALRLVPGSDWKTALVFLFSALALFRFNVGPTLVIPLAGVAGVIAHFIGA